MPPLRPATVVPAEGQARLVERCRAGDAEAVEQLYRAHSDAVARTLARLTGPGPDVEDLVQTVFAEALDSLDRFRGAASLRTWLLRIAVNVAHHHLRAGRVRRHVALELVDEDALGDEPPRHERRMDEQRLSGRLHALLDRISAKKRIALLLFVVEGRSMDEVAALMGASSTATRSRVFFARRELKALLEGDPELHALSRSLLGETPARRAT
jgi:RNA polymerase sigma-70 factor (ECF subfamily)